MVLSLKIDKDRVFKFLNPCHFEDSQERKYKANCYLLLTWPGCTCCYMYSLVSLYISSSMNEVYANASKLPADVRNKFCLPAPSKERYPSTLPGTHCSAKGASRFAIRNKKSSGMWRFSAIC